MPVAAFVWSTWGVHYTGYFPGMAFFLSIPFFNPWSLLTLAISSATVGMSGISFQLGVDSIVVQSKLY